MVTNALATSEASVAPSPLPGLKGRRSLGIWAESHIFPCDIAVSLEPAAAAKPGSAHEAPVLGDGLIGTAWLTAFALEVAKNRPRVHAEILSGLGAVAIVALEHLENVATFEVFARLGERRDRHDRLRQHVEILDADQRLVAHHERLLDAVLELANVARPLVLADGDQRVGRKA